MRPKQKLKTARETASAAVDRAQNAVIDTVNRATTTVSNSIETTTDTVTSALRSAGSRTKNAVLMTTVLALTGTQPVMAQPEGCNPPSDLQPVFNLLEAITDVTMMGGLTIAALGIALGGVFFMWPGQDNNRRAKSTITYTIIGTVIILSAHAIVAFVTSQMGGTVC